MLTLILLSCLLPSVKFFGGMGTLGAGIVLVLEMTDNYQLILPMIITCLGATLVAQFLGGKPLYSCILARTLARQAQQPSSVTAPIASIKS